jgi:hypothetical protein
VKLNSKEAAHQLLNSPIKPLFSFLASAFTRYVKWASSQRAEYEAYPKRLLAITQRGFKLELIEEVTWDERSTTGIRKRTKNRS